MVLVETVGVGQSEIAVSNMTDIFLLLLLPSGGDELQGIKRGVVELANFILINKADGDLVNAAQKTVSDYRAALQLLQRRSGHDDDDVQVFPISALTQNGIEQTWLDIETCWHSLKKNDKLECKRKAQRLIWLQEELQNTIYERINKHAKTNQTMQRLQDNISRAEISPGSAVTKIMTSLSLPK